MRKIFYPLMITALLLGALTSCDEDRDSNPEFEVPEAGSFVLNEPANKLQTYDLETADYIVLTTAQPDYGTTLAVTYSAYISIDGENYVKLSQAYTTTTIKLSASEINSTILDLIGDGSLDYPLSVYVKLVAAPSANGEIGVIESNVVELPSVQAYVPPVTIELPTKMHIVGSFAASNGWSVFVPLHAAYSQEGYFYGMAYFAAGDEFKVNPDDAWKGNDKGFGQMTVNESEAGLSAAGDGDGANIKVDNAGLYTVLVVTKISNGAISYTLSVLPAKLYVFGACAPNQDNSWAFDDANLFVNGTDGTATSPALGGSGEIRLSVDCGIDWWKTEFTIMGDGTLFYRNCDIPNNWADDLGADYSFAGEAGKSIKLDFNAGTGVMQ